MKKQKVVRTFGPGWTKTTEFLEKYLEDGWQVVMRTCFTGKQGETDCIEYILWKDE